MISPASVTEPTARITSPSTASSNELSGRTTHEVTISVVLPEHLTPELEEILGTMCFHAFNGALTPMVQCLLDTHDLSAGDLETLESIIKARKKSARK